MITNTHPYIAGFNKHIWKKNADNYYIEDGKKRHAGVSQMYGPEDDGGKEDEDKNMVTASAEYSHDEPAVQQLLCIGYQYKGE